ncbi:E3 ubiquitin-protein ligase RNF26 isoform X1 [Cyclopterus lumpus]|uniref:E3 ubiquitin-protein ligase RNF26 isoform X1 n=2 Tax=Cyclopterus lumpus TaxID=8103 RepID=UPI001486A3F1|nr:E3 ubiquitin-protein ligase RNF26 isoform X1 [Cyclopterus lumpus]
MGLVNFVIATVGKCLDAVCLLLDVNFLIVHSMVRTILAVITFITSLPTLLLHSVVELGDLAVFCLVSMAEATSNVAHSTVTMLGSLVLALEGLLESLKMVGYLSMHVLLRGKEHLCRGLLSVLEGCGIAVSLVVYFTNTVVNFALIATQNIYTVVVSVWQTVSSPLQTVLELTLTSFTFLYSSLVGTSAFLWSPCKLLLDFLVSLVHMFVSIFILNIYGLLLTVTIALTTTAYLNRDLTRQAAVRIGDYINLFPALHRLNLVYHRLASALQNAPRFLRGAMQRLQRIFLHLCLLERGLWQKLSRLSSQLSLALRTQLSRDNNRRVRGDGDPREERRDPPDGRAGDGAHQELLDLVFPSSSIDRPLKKQSSSGKNSKHLPAENLLTLLKEQEERKKCVICQDRTKTVVLLPCRHLCLCKDCTNILLRQPIYQQNCPLCRHMILNTMDVYL